MNTPTLKQLQKRPALYWDNVNDSFRITYPDGHTEQYDRFSEESEDYWSKSIFELPAFARGTQMKLTKKEVFTFIQFL